MAIKLNPYLHFRDSTREAMEFYRKVFGGQLQMRTFKELNASKDPAEDDLIMHASLEGDHGIVVMASDTPVRMEHRPGSNFSMSLSGDADEPLRDYFEELAEGGTVTMPLQTAIWGDTFGMCTDRFGVSWLVNISPGHSGT